MRLKLKSIMFLIISCYALLTNTLIHYTCELCCSKIKLFTPPSHTCQFHSHMFYKRTGSTSGSNNFPIDKEMGSAKNQRYIPLPAILIILILIQSAPAISSLNNRTAYEVLEDYNFPVGLLPKGVKHYDLNIITGEFSVHFNHTCSFSLKSSYHLKYKPTIKGYISNGKLFRLKGVYERMFLVWVEIEGIIRSGDDLVFSVGVLSSVFPIDYFEESPQCGCGFRCGGGQVRKLRTNTFVSPYEGS